MSATDSATDSATPRAASPASARQYKSPLPARFRSRAGKVLSDRRLGLKALPRSRVCSRGAPVDSRVGQPAKQACAAACLTRTSQALSGTSEWKRLRGEGKDGFNFILCEMFDQVPCRWQLGLETRTVLAVIGGPVKTNLKSFRFKNSVSTALWCTRAPRRLRVSRVEGPHTLLESEYRP